MVGTGRRALARLVDRRRRRQRDRLPPARRRRHRRPLPGAVRGVARRARSTPRSTPRVTPTRRVDQLAIGTAVRAPQPAASPRHRSAAMHGERVHRGVRTTREAIVARRRDPARGREELLGLRGIDAHQHAALPARRHRHVAADEEREPAEHPLLGDAVFTADELPDPIGQGRGRTPRHHGTTNHDSPANGSG